MKSIHDVFVRDPLLIISCGGARILGGGGVKQYHKALCGEAGHGRLL